MLTTPVHAKNSNQHPSMLLDGTYK